MQALTAPSSTRGADVVWNFLPFPIAILQELPEPSPVTSEPCYLCAYALMRSSVISESCLGRRSFRNIGLPKVKIRSPRASAAYSSWLDDNCLCWRAAHHHCHGFHRLPNLVGKQLHRPHVTITRMIQGHDICQSSLLATCLAAYASCFQWRVSLPGLKSGLFRASCGVAERDMTFCLHSNLQSLVTIPKLLFTPDLHMANVAHVPKS